MILTQADPDCLAMAVSAEMKLRELGILGLLLLPLYQLLDLGRDIILGCVKESP